MAHIHVTPTAEATGVTRREYDAATRRAGRIWNIVSIQSQLPEVMRDSMRLYSTIMFGASPLTRAQREMIAVVTSQVNECHYWITAHLHDLRDEVDDQQMVDRFAGDWRTAGLDDATQALLEFAEKLTDDCASTGKEEVAVLKTHGFDDAAVSSCVQVVAYFNYINRIAEGLGVDGEGWIDDDGRAKVT